MVKSRQINSLMILHAIELITFTLLVNQLTHQKHILTYTNSYNLYIIIEPMSFASHNVSYLKFAFVKVLEPLKWNNLIHAIEERLRLILDASCEPPLSHQTTTGQISQS